MNRATKLLSVLCLSGAALLTVAASGSDQQTATAAGASGNISLGRKALNQLERAGGFVVEQITKGARLVGLKSASAPGAAASGTVTQAQVNAFKAGFDAWLAQLQSEIAAQVFAEKLPLVGTAFSDPANQGGGQLAYVFA